MKVIKYLKNGQWIALYSEFLEEINKLKNNILYANNNLADLTDKKEALKNLGLLPEDGQSCELDNRYVKIDDINNLIDKKIKEYIGPNVIEGNISQLINIDYKNTWYEWQGSLDGVESTWLILKMNSTCTAINKADPRIVLRSNDFETWVPSYAYWHA